MIRLAETSNEFIIKASVYVNWLQGPRLFFLCCNNTLFYWIIFWYLAEMQRSAVQIEYVFTWFMVWNIAITYHSLAACRTRSLITYCIGRNEQGFRVSVASFEKWRWYIGNETKSVNIYIHSLFYFWIIQTALKLILKIIKIFTLYFYSWMQQFSFFPYNLLRIVSHIPADN